MGIRESLNQKPSLSTAICLIVMLGACAFMYRQYFRQPPPPKHLVKEYYTVDDGKTWFTDDVSNVPPYEYQGKEAVRVVLYRCGDNPPFAARLEKYSPAAKAGIAKEVAAGIPPAAAQGLLGKTVIFGLMVKKPGETEWVELKTSDYGTPLQTKLMSVQPPEGQHGALMPVTASPGAQP